MRPLLKLAIFSVLGVVPTIAQASDDHLLFFSKNNCKGNVVAQFRSPYYETRNCKRGGCENDEARSVFIERGVDLPLTVTVWDDAGGSYGGDDWASIHIWKKSQSMRTGFGVCIPSFESNYGKTWMNIRYKHGGNLDGKVSRIKFARN